MDKPDNFICKKCGDQAIVFEDSPENSYCEKCIKLSKFKRDEHVLDLVGGTDRINKVTATQTILGVSPENYDIMKNDKDFSPLKDKWIKINEAIDYYMDIPESTRHLIALWILGSHFHQQFNTFPILFINAMRGSGKTRLLGLMSHLSLGLHGTVQNNISESALFHSNGQAIFLDEMESLSSQERSHLILLLNSCYKKGAQVTRMAKESKDGKEGYVKEQHTLYIPVVIANINGLDSILENRAIVLILERSFNPIITSRLEDFEKRLAVLREELESLSAMCDMMTSMTPIIDGWNDYLDSQRSMSHMSEMSSCHSDLYQKMFESRISGRTLELCFPLLIISYCISPEVFAQSLNIFSEIAKTRQQEELNETDVLIYRFISTLTEVDEFQGVTDLLNRFQLFCNVPPNINAKSLGIALRRLQLVRESKHTAHSRLVKLDIERAKKRIGLLDIPINQKTQIKEGDAKQNANTDR